MAPPTEPPTMAHVLPVEDEEELLTALAEGSALELMMLEDSADTETLETEVMVRTS